MWTSLAGAMGVATATDAAKVAVTTPAKIFIIALIFFSLKV
jgi:hypothetical protein